MGACSVLSASVLPCIATPITPEPFEGRVVSGSAIMIGGDRVGVEAEEPRRRLARFGLPPAGNDRRAFRPDSAAPHAGNGRGALAPRDPPRLSAPLRLRSRPASATGCDADRSGNPPTLLNIIHILTRISQKANSQSCHQSQG